MRRALLTLLVAAVAQLAFGQLHPERGQVRRGNRAWERDNYVEAEGRYDAALSLNPASAEAHFNRGDVLYRQGRFEEAEAAFGAALPLMTAPRQAAGALHNQSAALVRRYRGEGYDRGLLDRALEASKQALRLDPTDEDAKFNLAYIQKLLEKDPDGGGGGGAGDNEDQQQDQQQDSENQPTPNDEQQQGENEGDPQPTSGLSERQIDQVLDALQNNEEQARALMEGDPAEQAAPRSGKNW